VSFNRRHYFCEGRKYAVLLVDPTPVPCVLSTIQPPRKANDLLKRR